jgi:glycosyltransferase involved in cell wall biosynthesis
MHILVPTGIFHPQPGGPATYLYHFLPELLAQGHTVEVVTFGEGTAEDYPYPVTWIPRSNILQRNWEYRQAVRQRLPKADGVFINSLGLQLPRLTRPSVLKIVGDRAWERCLNRGWLPATADIDIFQTKRYNPLIEWIKRARSHEAQAADHIIVPSDYLKKMVVGWGVPSERVQVIYNAFEAAKPPATTRAALNLPEDVPLLLVVARLTAWKGVDAVLEALLELPEMHLVVLGDGPALPDLRQMAARLNLETRVDFRGNLPPESVQQFYGVADYLVLYSGYEGLSHVILEALNAGTPVIASDKGGNPEIVRHGENGLLVPYKSVAALREALQNAFQEDTPQRLRQGAFVEPERFAWNRLVEETIATLERQFAR